MTLSKKHLEAMQRGRERKLEEQRAIGRKRVTDFTAWLKAGSVLRDIPAIPKDSDYACIK